MSREWKLFYQDLVDSCEKIVSYTTDMSFEQFISSGLNYDATVWNVQLLGEAAKNIPESVRLEMPAIPWQKLIGIRNTLAHGYFGINNEILWNVIQDKIPRLLADLTHMYAEHPEIFK